MSPGDGRMRTTLRLDDDVIDKVGAVATQLGTSFRTLVNEALRVRLDDVVKPATRRAL